MKKILRGTGVAIVTPFRDGAVDFKALRSLISHIIKGRCEYLVVLGTTGEAPVLSREEKSEILRFTYKTVKGRVPVVVGIGGNYTAAVIEEMQSLPLEGAVAILSASPYYNKPSQQGLIEHYRALASAAPLPLILYNVPARTGRNITAATTITLSGIPNIIGIKEASGDMIQCMEILKHCPKDFLVVSGDDALALPQLACGMDGVISVVANAFPAAFSSMVRYCLSMDFKKAISLNNKLTDIYEAMFRENNPAGVKAFLAAKGIIANELRLPGVPVSAGLETLIAELATSVK